MNKKIVVKQYGILGLMTLLLWLCGCNNDTAQDKVLRPYEFLPTGEDTTPLHEPLYPFVDYLGEQLKYLDSTPLGVTFTRHINGKLADSAFVDKQSVHEAVAPFLAINPNKQEYRAAFRETSLRDLTINRLIFTITTQRTDLHLKEITIFLDPEKQQVKNLVMRQQFKAADSTKDVHMVWLHKMHMQISENISSNAGESYTIIRRWVWDKPIE